VRRAGVEADKVSGHGSPETPPPLAIVWLAPIRRRLPSLIPAIYDALMASGRHRRGFERAGRLSADELGLPRAKAKELLLSAQWKRVVGEAIARKTSALAVRRGVLEIRLHDERWRETLTSLLPSLASRLATRCPELGVRKFALRGPGADPGVRPTAVVASSPEPAKPRAPSSPPKTAKTPEAETDAGTVEQRLARTMERYLDRSAGRPSEAPTRRR